MLYREYNCIVCGQKCVDRGCRQDAKYCGEKCRNKARRLKIHEGRVAAPVCPFNEGVDCFKKDCSNCGWNPDVEKKRRVSHE